MKPSYVIRRGNHVGEESMILVKLDDFLYLPNFKRTGRRNFYNELEREEKFVGGIINVDVRASTEVEKLISRFLSSPLSEGLEGGNMDKGLLRYIRDELQKSKN